MKTRIFTLLIVSLVVLAMPAVGTAVPGKPLTGLTILLDPGHGGQDPGAVGPTGLTEAATNLRVSRYLAQLLAADGARVEFTRDGDQTLTLAQRVQAAERLDPDLFVSIHHNASLGRITENRAEVYFNSSDFGAAAGVARALDRNLPATTGVPSSRLIPGGFFVLRNNPAPALLTEGSYLTLPLEEKALRSGRALTEEALAIHRAIRAHFAVRPLKIALTTPPPIEAASPWVTLLLGASGPIGEVRLEAEGPTMTSWRLRQLPMVGNLYSFANIDPLASGKYKLHVWARNREAAWSKRLTIDFSVALPVARCTIDPVLPYFPVGFRGAWPFRVHLFDHLDRPNPRTLGLRLAAATQLFNGTTRAEDGGVTHVVLPVIDTTSSSDQVELVVQSDEGSWVRRMVPIKPPRGRVALGRVVSSHTGNGLANCRIEYGVDAAVVTDRAGWFAIEWPAPFGRLKLDLHPPPGYARETRWLDATDRAAITPELRLAPTHPKLLDRKLAISTTDALMPIAQALHDRLAAAGANVQMLPLQRDEESGFRAVALANRIAGLDLVLALKPTIETAPVFRHYYRSVRAEHLGRRVAAAIDRSGVSPQAARVHAGGDYELGHTGATALVIGIPNHRTPGLEFVLIQALMQELANQ